MTEEQIPLLFTDPSYAEKDLPDYKDLGKFSMRVLQDGGSLVTYTPECYLDIVIEYLKASGLIYWGKISIELAGNHSEDHLRKMFIWDKTLLWFVKDDKLREGMPTKYVPNRIKSTVPDKLLHSKGWEQSATQAERMIEYLTFPNEVVLDCMCGTGTVGIAARKPGRQFVGIDIDPEECKNAEARIKLEGVSN